MKPQARVSVRKYAACYSFWLFEERCFCLHKTLSDVIIIMLTVGRDIQSVIYLLNTVNGDDVPGSFNLHVHLRHGRYFLCAGPSEDNRARGSRQCTQREKKKKKKNPRLLLIDCLVRESRRCGCTRPVSSLV